ncbi:tyrosine-type recombinase/integrase [Anaerotignum sp.]|uniref:tyrosine-type recombinase/integrase n=1 Tax=Anaerotignum sp. TaxID=2039241 RepID=UPI003FA46ECD
MEYPFYFSVCTDYNLIQNITAFNNTIKRVLKYIGIEEQGLSSHIFRHSFVMSMLANKTEPEKIIRFTGHSSVAELELYLHFNVDDLRDCLQDVA